MSIQKLFEIRTGKFEQVYGYAALFEIYLISIMNFLVEAGFISQEDLSTKIMQEMDRFEQGVAKMQEMNKPQEVEFTTTAPKEPLQSFSDFLKKENIT